MITDHSARADHAAERRPCRAFITAARITTSFEQNVERYL
jgi:hypothetical protein